MRYRDFAPVAVLGWEMAAIAPPEMDLAYLLITLRIALRRMRFGELVHTEHLDDALDPSHLQLLDELMAGPADA